MSWLEREERLAAPYRTTLGMAVSLSLAAWPLAAQADWSAIAEQKTSYTTNGFQFSSAQRPHVADLGRESLAVLSRAWQPAC